MTHELRTSPIPDIKAPPTPFKLVWNMTLLLFLSASQFVLLAMFTAFSLYAYSTGMIAMHTVISTIAPAFALFVAGPLMIDAMLLFLRNRHLKLKAAEKITAKKDSVERFRSIGAVPPAFN